MMVVPLLDRITGPLTGVSISDKVLALDGWALASVNVEFANVSPPMVAAMLIAGGLPWSVLGFRIRRTPGEALLQNLGLRDQFVAAAGILGHGVCPTHQASLQHHLPADGQTRDRVSGRVHATLPNDGDLNFNRADL